MTWITSSDIASYTGKTYSTSEQTELDRLCAAVENAFKKETGRDYSTNANDDVVEYFTGPDAYEFHLKNTPASSIVSVKIWNSVNQTYDTYTHNYWLVDNRKVILETKEGLGYPNEIEITYKGSTPPDDVKQALIEWVLLIWNARFDGGQIPKGESKGTARVDYYTIDNLPANIQSVINRYRIVNV